MKLLVYGVNYSPELVGIAKYTTEMSEWFAQRGDDVEVIAGMPYYPEWKLRENFPKFYYQSVELNAVNVTRCPHWVPKSPSGVKRIIHLGSFAMSSIFPLLRTFFFNKPDVVLIIVPTIFCAPFLLVLAKIFHVKSIIHVQDFEVDAAFSIGFLKSKSLRRFAHAFESYLLSSFDLVTSISGKMLQFAKEKARAHPQFFLFRNWVELPIFYQESEIEDYKVSLGIPLGKKIAMYSGNMGAKQGLDRLVDLAFSFREKSDLHFVFCGEGPEKKCIIERCSSLNNVTFLTFQPGELLPKFLQLADVHLLPQKADIADLVMPSKLNGIFASGKPVIATSVKGTELYDVVNGRGVVIDPTDSEGFSMALSQLLRDEHRAYTLGRFGRQYAEENLEKEKVLSAFRQEISHLLVSGKRSI